MAKDAHPKLDQIKALREANYERMMQRSRAQAAVDREQKKRELADKITAIEGDGPKKKPVKRKVSRKKRT